jgi:hypothetical protein
LFFSDHTYEQKWRIKTMSSAQTFSEKQYEMELVVDQRDDEVATPKYKAASPYYEMMVYSPPKGALSPSSAAVGKLSPQERFLERFACASSSALADPCGNGDQSPITEAADQALLLELFRVGGDFDEYLPKKEASKRKGSKALSELAAHCVAGRHDKVKQILDRHSPRQGKPWEALRELLERRETMLRYSPLLLVFCMLHKIGIVMTSASAGHSNDGPDEECNVTLHSYRSKRSFSSRPRSLQRKDACIERTSYYGLKKESWLEYIGELEQNLVHVVVELLYHGANPCAKDVLGRTVCFYGASVYATARSLQATTLCIQAAKSAHCFGKEIILQNMETTDGASKNIAKYNGMRGLAAGYQVQTARRIVYLFGQKAETAVLNRNICLVDNDTGITGEPPPLCDIPDRLGRVCVTELLSPSSSHRLDVVRFLLQQHQASIDSPDWNGQTIRQRSAAKLLECRRNEIPSTNAEVIAAREILSEALKRARLEQKCLESTCSGCSEVKSSSSSLQLCQHWYVV